MEDKDIVTFSDEEIATLKSNNEQTNKHFIDFSKITSIDKSDATENEKENDVKH